MPRGEVAQGVDQSEAWRPQVFFGPYSSRVYWASWITRSASAMNLVCRRSPSCRMELDMARLGTGAPELIGERLVVHQVHHRHAVGFELGSPPSWPGTGIRRS